MRPASREVKLPPMLYNVNLVTYCCTFLGAMFVVAWLHYYSKHMEDLTFTIHNGKVFLANVTDLSLK